MTESDKDQEEWATLTTDPRLIAMVDDALRVHHSSTPAIPVFHKGHAVGVAVRLSCQPWYTLIQADGDGDNHIKMQVETTGNGQESGSVESPAVPWFSYNFRCAECDETPTAKGTKLLRAALFALARKGRKGAAYKIALT